VGGEISTCLHSSCIRKSLPWPHTFRISVGQSHIWASHTYNWLRQPNTSIHNRLHRPITSIHAAVMATVCLSTLVVTKRCSWTHQQTLTFTDLLSTAFRFCVTGLLFQSYYRFRSCVQHRTFGNNGIGFLQAECPSCCSTNSVKALNGTHGQKWVQNKNETNTAIKNSILCPWCVSICWSLSLSKIWLDSQLSRLYIT